jgi:DNA-binding transcriptional ArsR family regulator
MSTPDYVALAAGQLRELRNGLLGQLAKIESALAALSEVSGHEEQVEMSKTVIPAAKATFVPSQNGEELEGEYSKMRTSEAVLAFVNDRDEERTVEEIVEALRAGRLRTRSNHLKANVYTTLRRLSDRGLVLKTDNGWRKVTAG